MQQFDKISRVVFYALMHDLNFRDYVDLPAAVKAQPYLIVQETSGSWYNQDDSNPLIQINLFNPNGQEIFELHELGWKLDSFEIWDIPQWPPYRTTELFARIVDPFGIIYPRSNYGTGVHGLIKSIKLLREMAPYECIENYELSKKNEDLKSQIEKVSAEIQLLKEKTSLS